MPQIEELLKSQGENVPRPDYSGRGATEEDENGQDKDDVEEGEKKANIEATSDEEE